VPSFDISAEEARVYANAHSIDRFLTYSLAGFGVVWAIVAVLLAPRIAGDLLSLTRISTYGWLVLALFGVIVVWGIVNFWLLTLTLADRRRHGGHGPNRIDVDSAGFTLVWKRGPPLRLAWAGIRRALVIKDFSVAGYQAQMQVSRFGRVALSGEAVTAIAVAAEKHGLRLATGRITGSTGTPGLKTTISRAR
jgi:hypothetical protein